MRLRFGLLVLDAIKKCLYIVTKSLIRSLCRIRTGDQNVIRGDDVCLDVAQYIPKTAFDLVPDYGMAAFL